MSILLCGHYHLPFVLQSYRRISKNIESPLQIFHPLKITNRLEYLIHCSTSLRYNTPSLRVLASQIFPQFVPMNGTQCGKLFLSHIWDQSFDTGSLTYNFHFFDRTNK
jgi:hypothetical protein